jgi:hypothetical protein
MVMNHPQFTNALKAMFNIDADKLTEIERDQQKHFIADPVRYYIRASEAQHAAIWREIKKRQRI